MKLRDDVNEYGTPVRVYQCEDCGEEFTVCPIPKNDSDWLGCMSPDCHSYDENRDADKLFDSCDSRVERTVAEKYLREHFPGRWSFHQMVELNKIIDDQLRADLERVTRERDEALRREGRWREIARIVGGVLSHNRSVIDPTYRLLNDAIRQALAGKLDEVT